jgi:hypothetical protein
VLRVLTVGSEFRVAAGSDLCVLSTEHKHEEHKICLTAAPEDAAPDLVIRPGDVAALNNFLTPACPFLIRQLPTL